MENYLELSGQDLAIFEGALRTENGQTQYQAENFVAGSQLTPYRMLKQCLIELDSRHHSRFNISNEIKRAEIEVQLAKRAQDKEEDDLKKQLIQCDIDDFNHDLYIWKRKLKQAEQEIMDYVNQAKAIMGDNTELLEKAISYDQEEERKYWITRMAKQAAMDMVSYGRIGTGNMDSIAMMPEEDQIMTLATTLQYHERLGNGMHQISKAVNEGLLQNKENLPKFDVPSITDQLLAPIESKEENVQRTSKPKTKSESI